MKFKSVIALQDNVNKYTTYDSVYPNLCNTI